MLPRLAAKVKWETGRPFLGREERAGQGGSGDGGRPAWKIRQRQPAEEERQGVATNGKCVFGGKSGDSGFWLAIWCMVAVCFSGGLEEGSRSGGEG